MDSLAGSVIGQIGASTRACHNKQTGSNVDMSTADNKFRLEEDVQQKNDKLRELLHCQPMFFSNRTRQASVCVVPNRHNHCSQALHHGSLRPQSSSTHVEVQMGLGPVACGPVAGTHGGVLTVRTEAC